MRAALQFLPNIREAPARTYIPRRADFSLFKRPPVLTRPETVTFMLLTVTQTKSTSDDANPIIHLHGLTEDRHSVWVNVYGSLPYCYIYFPTRRDFPYIVEILENYMQRFYKSSKFREKHVRSTYICKWEVVSNEDIRGYKGPGDTKRPFLKLYMQDKMYINDLIKHVMEYRVTYQDEEGDWDTLERGKIYEHKIKFEIQTLVAKDMNACFWINVHHARYKDDWTKRAQIYVECVMDDLEPLPNRADIAPIRMLSYDIECETQEDRFVDAKLGDPVITIGVYLTEHGRPESEDLYACISLRPEPGAETDPMENTHHFEFDDERDVLCGFQELINAADPDIITGYNIGPFDNIYVTTRAEELYVDHTFADTSRFRGWICKPKKKVFKSRIQGTKEGAIIKWPGRIQFDLLEYFQKNLKLHSYGLNAVSEKFLGERKAEMPIHLIYPYHHGTPAQRRKLYKYCVRDAWLPAAIIKKNFYIISLCEMCRAVGVPFDYLLELGQQAKTEKRILQSTKYALYVIPSFVPPKREYTGAIVVSPHKGFYEIPVYVNDFSSLYPSIMIAYNLCYTTFGYVSDFIRWGLVEGRDFLVPRLDFKDRPRFGFVLPHIRKGLLPDILSDLLVRRRAAKNQQEACEAAGDKAMAKIYEFRQLNLKLTGNSLYGFTSADKLPLTEIAETVTAHGRDMIQLTSSLIEGRFNRQTPDVPRCLAEGIDPNAEFSGHVIYYECDAKVIYGDSVTKDTRVLLRDAHENDLTCEIQDIPVQWTEIFGKEFGVFEDAVFTYTEDGWTLVHHAIRHKTTKRIFKISTWAGSSVQVTSDHSLLTFDKQLIKPTDIRVGFTRLLTFDSNADDGLVVCVEDLGVTKDYVYDLETENHHFAAGEGCLVVHNTDSVFVTFGNVSVQRAREIGMQSSAYCKPYYMPPNDSLFEKVLFPLLLQEKKKYSGIFHTWPKPDTLITKLDSKGIETVRRDWTKLCTNTLNACLQALMIRRDRQEVIQIVHRTIEQLYLNKTPMCDLVLTKGYSKSRKEYDQTFKETGTYPVHIAVAIKMEKRDKATAPKNGDRIPYVMISKIKREKIKGKGYKEITASEKAEDPAYVLKNDMVIDADWYVQKQLVGPLMRLLRVALCDDPFQIQDESGYYATHLKETDAYKKLFVGPHMTKRVKPIPKSGGMILNMIQRVPQCLACGTRAVKKPDGTYGPVCASCKPEKVQEESLVKLHTARKRVENVQQTCVTCQKGTPYLEIVCENKQCSNWWERISSTKQLTDIEDIISRFSNL